MYAKWLLTLVCITFLLLLLGFILHPVSIHAYLWMTMGMAAVSFLYFFMVTLAQKQTSSQVIGGNLAAIGLKFILSATLIIFYIVLTKETRRMDFVYFLLAYGIFSIINYTFSYFYGKENH